MHAHAFVEVTMRVGPSHNPYSAHQAGMSALWHDVDYIPEKRFETPLVQKNLDDMALPSQDHQLPDGVEDPFAKMEQVFDVAAQQMERGIAGSTFLHGKPPPPVDKAAPALPEADAIRQSVVESKKVSPAEQKALDLHRQDLEQSRRVGMAQTAAPTSKDASKTAAQKEREVEAPQQAGSSSPVSEALSAAATFVPMAAGQAIGSIAQGPLPALASTAVTTAGAVSAAAQVTATGIAEGLKEEAVTIKRGLKQKA